MVVVDIVKGVFGNCGKGVFWWELEWILMFGVGWKFGVGD